jgi:hypothetical protein
MKPVTNEQLAKALGWKRIQGLSASENKKWYWRQEKTGSNSCNCPPFTTDLNCIAGAIEAHGLGWQVLSCTMVFVEACVFDYVNTGYENAKRKKSKIPAQALANAFYAYLKGRKP